MANKPETQASSKIEAPMNAFAQLQEAGMTNMVGFGAAWMEALGDLNSEIASFVADRIKEDVKTQHKILHCKNVGDLQDIQAEFMKTALEQYQAETGKLIEMGTQAFSSKS